MVKLKPNFFDYVVNDSYSDWRWSMANHTLFLLLSLAFVLWLHTDFELSQLAIVLWYVLCAGWLKITVNGLISFIAYQVNPRHTPQL